MTRAMTAMVRVFMGPPTSCDAGRRNDVLTAMINQRLSAPSSTV